MRSARIFSLVAVGAILAIPAAGGPVVGAVERPTIDGPVPVTGALDPGLTDAGSLRLDGPCRTTAAVLDPAAAPASATVTDLRPAWIHGRGEGQIVAVIDTGVNPGPRLPRVRGAGDVVPGRDGTEDCDAHGTLVAGVLAATEDASGHSGVAPGVEIVSIRQSSSVLTRTGGRSDDPVVGAGVGTLSSLARAIRAAVDAGAGVINISEVACVPASTLLADDTLGGAIRYAAVDHDVVLVAAAGNVGGACGDQNPGAGDPTVPGDDGWDDVVTVAAPAWYDDHVLTVGGVDADGVPAEFSLRGPWVDVAAPAVGLRSVGADGAGVSDLVVDGDGSRSAISGTSFSAPFVAGTAALIRQARPDLTARQVIERIENTALPAAGGHDFAVGHGVVDPVAAVTGVRRSGRPKPATTTIAAPTSAPGPAGAGVGAIVAAGSLALGALVLVVVALTRPRGR
ncbi:type VII secretion-associated serine protease mycosin [Rhodococcus sp. IEGM 1408]|uniref:type VII secretion-associated serine protease mycosin n=1 Tax=Rhodococcus sp. IEGM 1408 TaxID=3082220 RepID=UPI0029531BA9|nr:type VII secretion-associated serine protease mycosin [Rhodococcus sp. IEGM 1408]MDV8001197.1 type VII secretion-associated serine protease mycosin [Rhodococcus sp. IEGM 1408]